jgi:hypothetical protein
LAPRDRAKMLTIELRPSRRWQQKRFTPQGIGGLKYDPAAAPPSGRMEIEDEVCPWA